MKKAVIIVICILGIGCLSSCRSTSSSCGLAKYIEMPVSIVQANLS